MLKSILRQITILKIDLIKFAVLCIFFNCDVSWSQNLRSSNFAHTNFGFEEVISLHSDSTFELFESADKYSKYGFGKYEISNKKLIFNFDTLSYQSDSMNIRITPILEKKKDSLDFTFIVLDLITKQPLPFSLVKVHLKYEIKKITTDFDGFASISLSSTDTIKEISVHSSDYEPAVFNFDPKQSCKVQIEMCLNKDLITNEKMRVYNILKIKTRGIYLSIHGVKRFYRFIL